MRFWALGTHSETFQWSFIHVEGYFNYLLTLHSRYPDCSGRLKSVLCMTSNILFHITKSMLLFKANNCNITIWARYSRTIHLYLALLLRRACYCKCPHMFQFPPSLFLKLIEQLNYTMLLCPGVGSHSTLHELEFELYIHSDLGQSIGASWLGEESQIGFLDQHVITYSFNSNACMANTHFRTPQSEMKLLYQML